MLASFLTLLYILGLLATGFLPAYLIWVPRKFNHPMAVWLAVMAGWCAILMGTVQVRYWLAELHSEYFLLGGTLHGIDNLVIGVGLLAFIVSVVMRSADWHMESIYGPGYKR